MFYHEATNLYIPDGVPFTLDGIQYPANWDRASLGLVEVVTVGQREDDRYFFVTEEVVGAERRITNTPKSDEQIKEVKNGIILAEIDALERQSMVPRAVREYMLLDIETKAIAAGHTLEELRSLHFGYRKTKELDELLTAKHKELL